MNKKIFTLLCILLATSCAADQEELLDSKQEAVVIGKQISSFPAPLKFVGAEVVQVQYFDGSSGPLSQFPWVNTVNGQHYYYWMGPDLSGKSVVFSRNSMPVFNTPGVGALQITMCLSFMDSLNNSVSYGCKDVSNLLNGGVLFSDWGPQIPCFGYASGLSTTGLCKKQWFPVITYRYLVLPTQAAPNGTSLGTVNVPAVATAVYTERKTCINDTNPHIYMSCQ